MANILIMDDESLSLRSLVDVLDKDGHRLSTAETPAAGLNTLERSSGALDLLVVNVSMFEAAKAERPGLLARAGLKTKLLVITCGPKYLPGRYPQLRIPFTDEHLLQAVAEVLAAEPGAAKASNTRPIAA